MTDNSEKIERLLEEAFAHRDNLGPSRLTEGHTGSLYPIQAMTNMANAFSALAEATTIAAAELEELNKKIGDLAERLGD